MIHYLKPDNYDYFRECVPEEYEKICNGVGAKGDWRNAFIPKTIYGLDITEPANIHDFMYHIGETKEDKVQADIFFHKNMYKLIDKNSYWLRFVRKLRADKYYWAVCKFGDDAFFKNKKEKI